MFSLFRFDLSSLEGSLDLSDGAIVTGHSFGGATAVKALQTHNCFSLGFCLDAWMFPIKFEAKELKTAGGEKPLAFVNYEKFQWINNLKTMRNFEGSLNLSDENGVGENDSLLKSNVYTIKQAIHYTASDLPTLFEGSYLSYPLSCLAWLTGKKSGAEGNADSASLSPQQAHSASVDLMLSFVKSVNTPSSLSLLLRGTKDFAARLSDYRSCLIWGTEFMEEKESQKEEK